MSKEVRWLGKRRCPSWPLPMGSTLLTLIHLTHLIVKAFFSWHGLTFSLTIQKEIWLFLCTHYQSNASSHQHTILGHDVYKNLKARVQGVRRSLHERGCYSNSLEEERTWKSNLKVGKFFKLFLSFLLNRRSRRESYVLSLCREEKGWTLRYLCWRCYLGAVGQHCKQLVNWTRETWAPTSPLTLLCSRMYTLQSVLCDLTWS